MQGPKWPLFYSHVNLVWSLLIVGTDFVPWVELPVQRRLCPIFVSGVELPTSTSIPWVDGLSTDPRVLGRHNCIGCILGIAPRTKETLLDFH